MTDVDAKPDASGPGSPAGPPRRLLVLRWPPAAPLPWLAIVLAALTLIAVGAFGVHELVMAPEQAQLAAERQMMASPGMSAAHDAAKAARRDFVVWRDGKGDVYRAKVDPAKLARFLNVQRTKLDTARRSASAFIAASLHAGIDPIFSDIADRIPRYADWYYSFFTKYVMMGHAVMPVIDYAAGRLTGRMPPTTHFVKFIEGHLVGYLENQYSERVLHPDATSAKLENAFARSFAPLQAQWMRRLAERDGAMQTFIAQEARERTKLSAADAAKAALDWDAQGGPAAHMHEDIYIVTTFRRGLLSLMVVAPRGGDRRQSLTADDGPGDDSDEVAHVIMNLFTRVVEPVISEMGNATAGIVAGGVAGGVASGGVIAASATVAVPAGAAVGLASTVAAELISDRVEESLTRVEFERNLRATLTSTQQEILSTMSSVLQQHVAGWYNDATTPGAHEDP